MKKVLMLVMVLCLGLAVVPGRAAVYFELWDIIPPIGTGDSWVDANGDDVDGDGFADGDGIDDEALLAIDWVTVPAPEGKNDQTDTLVGPTGEIANFGVGAFEVDDTIEDYTYRQIGILNIAAAGTYSFWINTDDGGLIYVNGVLVANWDGLHGARSDETDGLDPPTVTVHHHGKSTQSIDLGAGPHLVEVLMYERGGGDNLWVYYADSANEQLSVSIPDADLSLPVIPSNPASWAMDVPLQDEILSWSNPLAASQFNVYFETHPGIGDPNQEDNFTPTLVDGDSIAIADLYGALDNNTRYFIRIDTLTDSNDLRGAMFAFDTLRTDPIIDTQPQSVMVGPACSSEFTVIAKSGINDDVAGLEFEWFTAAGVSQGVPTTSPDFTTGIAGDYYCVVSNVSGSVTSDTVTLTIADLSQGGESGHIGPEAEAVAVGASPAEGWSVDDGVYTIAGAGQDIWGHQDDFYYVYVPLEGDADVMCRVTELKNEPVHDWQKAGIMIYDDVLTKAHENDPEGSRTASRHACIALSSASGVSFQRRNTVGADAGFQATAGLVYPYWVRLVRAGDVFSGYHAPDVGGAPGAWTKQGDDQTVVMTDPVYIGLAVTSHVSGQAATATFDNVDFLGADWAPENLMPDGSVWISPLEDAILMWDKAELGPCDGTYDVIISTDEALIADVNALDLIDGTNGLAFTGLTDLTATVPAAAIDYEGEYYWAVIAYNADKSLSKKSAIVYVEAVKLVPDILGQPQSAAIPVLQGGTATFSITTASDTPTTYAWYKEGVVDSIGAGDSVVDPDDSTITTNTLTLAGVGIADDGMYYCIATNTSGPATSDSAVLEIGQIIGHWTMDAIEEGTNIVADSSGNGRDGIAMGDPNLPIVVPGKIGNAIEFNTPDQPQQWVDCQLLASELGIGGSHQKTVSAWVYTKGFNDGGLFDLGNRASGENFSLRTVGNDHRWRIQYWGGDLDFQTDTAWNFHDPSESWNADRPAPAAFASKDAWVHFVHSYDGDTTRIYGNGRLIAVFGRTINTADNFTFRIGAYGPNPSSVLIGIIDDVRLYNYAISGAEAAQLYVDVEGGSVVFEDPLYDFNGDGVVDLADFAILAADMMECVMIPCDRW